MGKIRLCFQDHKWQGSQVAAFSLCKCIVVVGFLKKCPLNPGQSSQYGSKLIECGSFWMRVDLQLILMREIFQVTSVWLVLFWVLCVVFVWFWLGFFCNASILLSRDLQYIVLCVTAVPDRGSKLLLRAPRTSSGVEFQTSGTLRWWCSHFQLQMPVKCSSDKPFQFSLPHPTMQWDVSIFAIQSYLKLLYADFHDTRERRREEKEKSGRGGGWTLVSGNLFRASHLVETPESAFLCCLFLNSVNTWSCKAMTFLTALLINWRQSCLGDRECQDEMVSPALGNVKRIFSTGVSFLEQSLTLLYWRLH